MENASNALIMAASVLIGVLILSIGVVLFTNFSDAGHSTAEKMNEKKLSEWNNAYLKYYGTNTVTKIVSGVEHNVTEPIRVTPHDIVTVINSARENNIKNDFGAISTWDSYRGQESCNYVQIIIRGKTDKAETWDKTATDLFLKECISDTGITKYYYCKECKISSITKKVYKVTFELMP